MSDRWVIKSWIRDTGTGRIMPEPLVLRSVAAGDVEAVLRAFRANGSTWLEVHKADVEHPAKRPAAQATNVQWIPKAELEKALRPSSAAKTRWWRK